MSTVVRIKRKDGKVVQDCDVYIGRACYTGGWKLAESKWACPFKSKRKDRSSRTRILKKYEDYIRGNKELMGALPELEGKVLGCWCKPEPCHGDILIKLLQELSAKDESGTQSNNSESSESSEESLASSVSSIKLKDENLNETLEGTD